MPWLRLRSKHRARKKRENSGNFIATQAMTLAIAREMTRRGWVQLCTINTLYEAPICEKWWSRGGVTSSVSSTRFAFFNIGLTHEPLHKREHFDKWPKFHITLTSLAHRSRKIKIEFSLRNFREFLSFVYRLIFRAFDWYPIRQPRLELPIVQNIESHEPFVPGNSHFFLIRNSASIWMVPRTSFNPLVSEM